MTSEQPLRRVTMAVTGYLRTGHPSAGWWDLSSNADGKGVTWSVPEFAVDEASVTDAPPEVLTRDDWDGIEATLLARLGPERGRELLAEWRLVAETHR